jgi:hypothetical protein
MWRIFSLLLYSAVRCNLLTYETSCPTHTSLKLYFICMTSSGSSRDEDVAEKLNQLMHTLPEEPSQRLIEAQRLRLLFHERLALAVQPAVNGIASQHKSGCPENERNFAAELNDKMRMLGLTFREPRSLRPARLVVDTRGSEQGGDTRFRYCIRTDKGYWTNTNSSQDIPVLEVVPASPREENLARSVRAKKDFGRGRS